MYWNRIHDLTCFSTLAGALRTEPVTRRKPSRPVLNEAMRTGRPQAGHRMPRGRAVAGGDAVPSPFDTSRRGMTTRRADPGTERPARPTDCAPKGPRAAAQRCVRAAARAWPAGGRGTESHWENPLTTAYKRLWHGQDHNMLRIAALPRPWWSGHGMLRDPRAGGAPNLTERIR